MDDDGRAAVKVVVRVRECTQTSPDFVVGKDLKSVTLRQSKFDLVDGKAKDEQELLEFGCETVLNNAGQERTFDVVGKQATDAVLAGYNGTVLCYGQTGAGKSFTMVGSRDHYHQRGVAARAIAHAFREAANRPADEYTFRFSCLEIYNDQMYDLLSTLPSEGPRRELSLHELRGKVEVKGLLNPEVESEEQALQLLFEAESNRAVAQHQLNLASSRSHVLYMLYCQKRSKVATGAVVHSKLTLVDLAGSERLKKSAASGDGPVDPASARQLAKEAMSINKSLSFLEQVVVALGARKGHVPHRSSKLTSVLRESLGGNCKTLLVANVWPEARHMEESLSTLKFAARMQSVTNMAAINSQAEVSPQAALAACQAQLVDLKRELAMHDQLAGRGHISYDAYTPAQRSELRGRVQHYLEGDTPDLEVTTLRQIRESFDIVRQLYQEQAAQLRTATESVAAMQAAGGGGGGGGLSMQGELESSPPVEVVDFVGETEPAGGASGFGCGVAPSDARPADAQYAKANYSAASSPSAGSPMQPPAAARPPSAPYAADAGGVSAGEADRFFSDFKRGVGATLAHQLRENKGTLREKRAAARRYGLEVNAAKREIDRVTGMLEQARLSRPAGATAMHNGVPADVIDDEEFALLSEQKAAKARYRQNYELMREEQANTSYVSSTVEACRSQLLADFSKWMGSEHPEAAASAAVLAAAAAGGERADSVAQPSSYSGGPAYGGTSSIYGAGYGGAGYGGGSLVLGANGSGGGGVASEVLPPPTPYDQDEQFEQLETTLAMERDPDSLPFFKASKLARASETRKKRAGDATVRAKPTNSNFVL